MEDTLLKFNRALSSMPASRIQEEKEVAPSKTTTVTNQINGNTMSFSYSNTKTINYYDGKKQIQVEWSNSLEWVIRLVFIVFISHWTIKFLHLWSKVFDLPMPNEHTFTSIPLW